MNTIFVNTTLLIGLVPGPVLKGNAQAFTVYSQPKYFGGKSHFPRECDMKSFANVLGDLIRVNIVLKYLKLCKDEKTVNICFIRQIYSVL